MHLLAQINFAEIEQSTEPLPTSGLLQFFIAAGDLYGSDFTRPGGADWQPAGYAVIFHPDPDPAAHVPAPVPDPSDDDMLPLRGESGMTFQRIDSRASPVDYRFDHLLPDIDGYAAFEPMYDYAMPDGPHHQLGGYAYFTQTDPRSGDTADEGWLLLLQVDSETVGTLDMMWGDVGVANFFVRAKDLAEQDFSRVWYNWDCS